MRKPRGYLTTSLFVVVETCLNSHIYGVIDKEINHHFLARFSEECQQLWPRCLSEGFDI